MKGGFHGDGCCIFICLTGSAWCEWNRRYGRCAREDRSNWRCCKFISFTSDIRPPPPTSISASPLFSLLTSLLSSLHLPPSMHFSLCNLSCTYLLNISTLSSSSPTSLSLTYAHREMKVQLGHQDCQDLRGQPVSL